MTVNLVLPSSSHVIRSKIMTSLTIAVLWMTFLVHRSHGSESEAVEGTYVGGISNCEVRGCIRENINRCHVIVALIPLHFLFDASFVKMRYCSSFSDSGTHCYDFQST